MQLRRILARHDLTGTSIDAHVDGPMLRITGNLYPGIGGHLPALTEDTAVSIERECQPFGPGAPKGFAPGVGAGARQQRTFAKILVLENPGSPGLEIPWNVDRTASSDDGGDQTQQA